MARVLLVEDDREVLEILRQALLSAGHDAEPVFRYSHAVRAFKSHRHDLMVADVVLPDGSGCDLAGRVRAAGKAVVMITGYDERLPALRDLRLPHLRKPFPLSDLIAAVERQLSISP